MKFLSIELIHCDEGNLGSNTSVSEHMLHTHRWMCYTPTYTCTHGEKIYFLIQPLNANCFFLLSQLLGRRKSEFQRLKINPKPIRLFIIYCLMCSDYLFILDQKFPCDFKHWSSTYIPGWAKTAASAALFLCEKWISLIKSLEAFQGIPALALPVARSTIIPNLHFLKAVKGHE